MATTQIDQFVFVINKISVKKLNICVLQNLNYFTKIHETIYYQYESH